MKKRRIMPYIFIFLLSLFIYGIVLFLGKCLPLGDRCFLSDDAYVQYNTMLRVFIEWFHGDKGVFMWNKAFGTDFYLTALYYLMSPFNVIALILGENNVELSLTLIIILKSSLIPVSALYFFKHTNNISQAEVENGFQKQLICIVCSLAFGFSGYILAYNHNTIWLDGLFIIPLLAIGIERLCDTGKYGMYLALLVASFVVNFYFSFYVCMFIVFYYLLQNRKNVKSFFKNTVVIALISLLAAAISGVVLLPAAFCVKNAGVSAGGLGQEYLEKCDSISSYTSSFFPFKTLSSDYLFNHNSFCGTLIITLTALFFVSKVSTIKEKIKYGITVAFLIISLNFVYPNYVLHGFVITHGMGNRFAFILTFILILMAYKTLMDMEKIMLKDVILAGFISLIWFVLSMWGNDDFEKPLGYVTFILLSITYLILGILYGRKSIAKNTLIYWMVISWGLEILANVCFLMPNKTYDTHMIDNIYLCDWQQEYDDLSTLPGERKTALVRDNFTTKTDTNWYSSMINGNTINAFDSMGLSHFDNVENVYGGTTELTSLLFNVRYVLTQDLGIYGGYHIKDQGQLSMEENLGEDKFYVYEADELAGLGFMVSDKLANWKGTENPAENQNQFFNLAVDHFENNLFTKVDLSNAKISFNCMDVLKSTEDSCIYRCNTIYTPNMHVDYVASEDMQLYMYSTDTKNQYVRVTVDGEIVASTVYDTASFFTSLGDVKKGQEIRIVLYGCAASQEAAKKTVSLYSFNKKYFDKYKGEIQKSCLVTEKMDKNEYRGSINVEKEGILYLAFPYNDGYTILIDGKETNKLPLGQGFMGVYLQEGDYVIEIKYKTPFALLGFLISLMGVGILILLNVRKNSIGKRKK